MQTIGIKPTCCDLTHRSVPQHYLFCISISICLLSLLRPRGHGSVNILMPSHQRHSYLRYVCACQDLCTGTPTTCLNLQATKDGVPGLVLTRHEAFSSVTPRSSAVPPGGCSGGCGNDALPMRSIPHQPTRLGDSAALPPTRDASPDIRHPYPRALAADSISTPHTSGNAPLQFFRTWIWCAVRFARQFDINQHSTTQITAAVSCSCAHYGYNRRSNLSFDGNQTQTVHTTTSVRAHTPDGRQIARSGGACLLRRHNSAYFLMPH
ncbi:hypothetical protein BKA62DRAFT_506857 [Auriculariales sp. MPI-PUGE-AT-0066]|nr:hypothetical protein BKA62DRAFT_506857 [Auriculariales sp. MPI-PUGE-AT-0066]